MNLFHGMCYSTKISTNSKTVFATSQKNNAFTKETQTGVSAQMIFVILSPPTNLGLNFSPHRKSTNRDKAARIASKQISKQKIRYSVWNNTHLIFIKIWFLLVFYLRTLHIWNMFIWPFFLHGQCPRSLRQI